MIITLMNPLWIIIFKINSLQIKKITCNKIILKTNQFLKKIRYPNKKKLRTIRLSMGWSLFPQYCLREAQIQIWQLTNQKNSLERFKIKTTINPVNINWINKTTEWKLIKTSSLFLAKEQVLKYNKPISLLSKKKKETKVKNQAATKM